MSSSGAVSAQTVGSSETERQYPILMSYKHSHGIPGVSTVGSSEAIRQENPHL